MQGNYFNTAQNVGYIDGQVYRDHNAWRRDMAAKGYSTNETTGGTQGQGASNAGGIPTFNFDWAAAEKDALQKLAPYYQQKLDQANGDVERAKTLLEEDYQKGLRRSQEDQTRINTQTQQDYQSATQADTLTAQQETRDTRGELNNRGVLVGQQSADQSGTAAPNSGYAQDWYLNPLNQRQQLRKLAIDRALERQQQLTGITTQRTQEDLATTKQRGVDDQNIALGRYKTDLEEQKKEQAVTQMAPLQYQQEYQKYKYLNNIPG